MRWSGPVPVGATGSNTVNVGPSCEKTLAMFSSPTRGAISGAGIRMQWAQPEKTGNRPSRPRPQLGAQALFKHG